MSGASSSSQQRPLTLTEELEKLEQSITLTLQEIDHNFHRAHRIVTSSILPIVEQYANHSKDVWEGSKFWKQFFESSANVSLSGYEEQPSTLDRADDTITDDSNLTTHTTLETSDSYDTPSAQHISIDSIQDLDVSDLTTIPSQDTPRVKPHAVGSAPAFSQPPVPYEALRQENPAKNASDTSAMSHTSTVGPETPRRSDTMANRSAAMAMTPTDESSPFLPPKTASVHLQGTARKRTDPLLHNVLDRNYRVQATPLTSTRYADKIDATRTPGTAARTRTRIMEPVLSSSPEIAAPELHAEVFSSPQRKLRLPGVSVLTPGRAKNGVAGDNQTLEWDSDDDEDDYGMGGISPPKTMQFHIPQRRLLKTPAKEASRRIVEDLLTTAGMAGQDEDEFSDEIDSTGMDMAGHLDEDSPSVVRKAAGFEDETF